MKLNFASCVTLGALVLYSICNTRRFALRAALVPTLGCSRPPGRNLDLLRYALSGIIISQYILVFQQNGPYISRARLVIPQERKHRLTQTLSLVPRRARARAAGERRFPLVPCHVPTARSGDESPQGGAPAIPTLVGGDEKSTYNADNITNQQVSVLYIQIEERQL